MKPLNHKNARRITRIDHKGRQVKTCKDTISHAQALAEMGHDSARACRFLAGEVVTVCRTICKRPTVSVRIDYVPGPLGRSQVIRITSDPRLARNGGIL